ncbi:acetate--CoA ligase family protein [Roseovarius confluentis]|uniref:acetate--CoA ligase family protein n=1 Tax=Roseovarius confluentis TaxID=1852027 RepID=UPI000CDE4DE8|nr:acetate--CoA ligase family protein [Roseovarius confluentis]
MNDYTIPRKSLATLFQPDSVAVIGASEDQAKFGGRLFHLLVRHGFDGRIIPINPKREMILGLPAFATVTDAPGPVDMAAIVVPREMVPAALRDCAAAGVQSAVIITNGFSEADEAGAALEAEVLAIARQNGIRLIGPNCLGFVSPGARLCVSSSPAFFIDDLKSGSIAFTSQSGAMMATLFDKANEMGIGFSHLFSIGNQADLELCDFVDFAIDDPATRVITSYIEGLKAPPRFVETARRARAAGKPWLVVRAGRTASGAAAAFSHTASLSGNYKVFDTICRENGVLPMDDLDAMITLAAVLGASGAPKPGAVGGLSFSGGGTTVLADRLTEAGLPLAEWSDGTRATLAEYLPEAARLNPIDATAGGARNADTVRASATALCRDPGVAFGMTAVTTVPALADVCEAYADGIDAARKEGQEMPNIMIMFPGAAADEARDRLKARGQVIVDTLDTGIRALQGWMALREMRVRPLPSQPEGMELPKNLFGALSEDRSKEVLKGIGVPVNAGGIALDAEEARRIAGGFDGPAVVKIVSPQIVHKSDAGGVRLNLNGPDAVAAAVTEMGARISRERPDARIEGYSVQAMQEGELELLVGARNDDDFGPVVMIGAGGILVELLADVSLASAPVDAGTAEAMIDRLAIAPMVAGFRGSGPLDRAALVDAIVRVSHFAALAGPGFRELDINPLLLRKAGEGCVAVDARILMADNND